MMLHHDDVFFKQKFSADKIYHLASKCYFVYANKSQYRKTSSIALLDATVRCIHRFGQTVASDRSILFILCPVKRAFNRFVPAGKHYCAFFLADFRLKGFIDCLIGNNVFLVFPEADCKPCKI